MWLLFMADTPTYFVDFTTKQEAINDGVDVWILKSDNSDRKREGYIQMFTVWTIKITPYNHISILHTKDYIFQTYNLERCLFS